MNMHNCELYQEINNISGLESKQKTAELVVHVPHAIINRCAISDTIPHQAYSFIFSTFLKFGPKIKSSFLL